MKKRVMWDEAAEADLIQLWQEKTPQLRSTRKNSHIYEEMSREMNTAGHNYTATEIKIKIHNFTNKYRQEKQKVSGGSPSVWKHYAAVREAVGGYKSFCSAELVEDSIMVDIDNIESPLSNPFAPADHEAVGGYKSFCSNPVDIKTEVESPLSNTFAPASHEAVDGYKTFCSADRVEQSIMDVKVEVESPISSLDAPPSPSAFSSNAFNRPSSSDAGKTKNKTAVSVMEEMRQDFLKATQAMKEADEKRLRILEKYARDVSEMKDAFIDFLRRQN
ncbi:uncharacterized protein [Bactrocera oleae]|uniref:uncharacterized protein n=1 Tax=Bactrocera oleae TaxID=104688 RepID=UPI0006B7FBA3